jgi:hypothetical protein
MSLALLLETSIQKSTNITQTQLILAKQGNKTIENKRNDDLSLESIII